MQPAAGQQQEQHQGAGPQPGQTPPGAAASAPDPVDEDGEEFFDAAEDVDGETVCPDAAGAAGVPARAAATQQNKEKQRTYQKSRSKAVHALVDTCFRKLRDLSCQFQLAYPGVPQADRQTASFVTIICTPTVSSSGALSLNIFTSCGGLLSSDDPEVQRLISALTSLLEQKWRNQPLEGQAPTLRPSTNATLSPAQLQAVVAQQQDGYKQKKACVCRLVDFLLEVAVPTWFMLPEGKACAHAQLWDGCCG